MIDVWPLTLNDTGYRNGKPHGQFAERHIPAQIPRQVAQTANPRGLWRNIQTRRACLALRIGARMQEDRKRLAENRHIEASALNVLDVIRFRHGRQCYFRFA